MSKKKGITIISVFIVIFILIGGVFKRFKVEDKNMEITCMSFNVLGVDNVEGYLPSEIRAQYLETFINESGIDLIGLQEAGSHSYDYQE